MTAAMRPWLEVIGTQAVQPARPAMAVAKAAPVAALVPVAEEQPPPVAALVPVAEERPLQNGSLGWSATPCCRLAPPIR